MSGTEQRTIPVCSCAEPDRARDFPVPLCCGRGRLVVPSEMAAMKRVEVRVRDRAAYPREHCGDSLLSGSHGSGGETAESAQAPKGEQR